MSLHLCCHYCSLGHQLLTRPITVFHTPSWLNTYIPSFWKAEFQTTFSYPETLDSNLPAQENYWKVCNAEKHGKQCKIC